MGNGRDVSYYPVSRMDHSRSTYRRLGPPIKKQNNCLIPIIETIQNDILVTTKSYHQHNGTFQLDGSEARAGRDVPDIQHPSLFFSCNCQPFALEMETADLRVVGEWRRICFYEMLALVSVQRLDDNIGTYAVKSIIFV